MIFSSTSFAFVQPATGCFQAVVFALIGAQLLGFLLLFSSNFAMFKSGVCMTGLTVSLFFLFCFYNVRCGMTGLAVNGFIFTGKFEVFEVGRVDMTRQVLL